MKMIIITITIIMVIISLVPSAEGNLLAECAEQEEEDKHRLVVLIIIITQKVEEKNKLENKISFPNTIERVLIPLGPLGQSHRALLYMYSCIHLIYRYSDQSLPPAAQLHPWWGGRGGANQVQRPLRQLQLQW